MKTFWVKCIKCVKIFLSQDKFDDHLKKLHITENNLGRNLVQNKNDME